MSKVAFNNDEHICHMCWTRARRGALTLPHQIVENQLLVLQPIAEVQEIPVEILQLQIPQLELIEDREVSPPVEIQQDVTFNLPGYSRAPNTSNACMAYNCGNASRRRVPESLKLQLLLHHNYYIPSNARVCEEHFLENTWDDLPNAMNRCFNFNPDDVINVIELLKQPRNNKLDFENLTEQHASELHYWTGRTIDEFERILQETPSLTQCCRNARRALGIYLSKIRSGESDQRLGTFFHMSRQNIERLTTLARRCLENNFVPLHLGFDHINRQQVIERNLVVPDALFSNEGGAEEQNAIVICDATYIFIQKSSNFSFQKDTYSLHKYRNLLKPFLFVTCDGHIVDVYGPYSARKSDGAILNGLLKGPGSVLHWFFESNDIFILDRGFRDSIPLLESHGYVGVMPESKARGATQLTAIQANKSRMCTICRWPVEIVNGRLKRDFKILRQEYFNVAMRHMFTDVKIAAALTNTFHPVILNNYHAEQFIDIARERLNVDNHLANYIDTGRLNRIRAAFEDIAVDQNNIEMFPILSEDALILFAVGTYQIKLAPSYYSEHVRSGSFTIQKYNGELNNLALYNMPSNNVQLLRAHIKSRHTSTKIYHVYILIDGNNEGLNSLRNYCCSCFIGRRTIGCCAHTMCLVWFLGWSRHQNVIRRPALFLDSIIIDDIDDDE
ncbi:Vacuolar protein sorting-associated protein 13C [Operophtera brumata]|uniref:Vacuolar protein sorting-associated protein 13C n=1 Tax=Operophtera brumata TaxID=104452 RepID=A0A0L7L764_OPEBR|nr:Vacuolar protein sorting-associated protein 13C [Operophtera brumata]